MVIKPMVRNGVCINAHPDGCRVQVERQIEYAKRQRPVDGPKRVLVIGSSTGYGLASRIVSTFSSGAATIGIFYERAGSNKRSGTAGWYNSAAFQEAAQGAGHSAVNINADAFSDDTKERTVETIRQELGAVDLVVYSLAAPARTDPDTGERYSSVIKPIGEPFASVTADPMSGTVSDIAVPPATDEEIKATVKVMGGEDWRRWIRVLADAGALSCGVTTVAYSYIGPPATQPVYRSGTLGKAKEHLESSAVQITDDLAPLGGSAYVSVNKALVTRASAVIPVVPLYVSLLYDVMKRKEIHEDCIHQIYRLFTDRLFSAGPVPVDDHGRIRMDDLEMRTDVQREVTLLWTAVRETRDMSLVDFEEYRRTFLAFHGFGIPGVDYDRDVEP